MGKVGATHLSRFALPFRTAPSALRRLRPCPWHPVVSSQGGASELQGGRRVLSGIYSPHSIAVTALAWLLPSCKASQLRTALSFLVLGNLPCPGPTGLRESDSSAATGPGFLNSPLWFSHTPMVLLLLASL